MNITWTRRGSLIAGLVLAVAGVVLLAVHPGSGPGSTIPSASPSASSAVSMDRISRSEQLLVARCMRRKGFSYPEIPARTGSSVTEPTERPFGLDDVAWARRHGFGSALQAAPPAPANDPLARQVAAMSPAKRERFSSALYGSPTDPSVSVTLPNGYVVTAHTRGCQAEARGWLYGDQRAWIRADVVVQSLPGLATKLTYQDPSFTAVQREWSLCMSKAGHPAPGPLQLRAGFVEDRVALSATRRRTLEVQLATAEADCAHRTGLVERGERVQARLRQRLTEQHRASVAEVTRLKARAAARANELLGGV